jgi:hypothetical protein
LRSKGAPLDRKFGVFPEAVMMANELSSDTAEPSLRFKQQMDMVTHLFDVVGCDVYQDRMEHTTHLAACAARRSAGSHVIREAPT